MCKAEYRTLVPEKYKKKIELLARRPETEEAPSDSSECGHCGWSVGVWELSCGNCSNNLPWCVSTGTHLTTTDLCFCPNCQFPSSYNVYSSNVQQGVGCSMCNVLVPVTAVTLQSSTQAQQWFKSGAKLNPSNIN